MEVGLQADRRCARVRARVLRLRLLRGLPPLDRPMTATHIEPTHECSDDYCVGRDNQGHLRMSGGRGRMIATSTNTIDDVRGWFERSKPGRFREDYRAVLRFMRVEAGAPDARPVHRDEVHPPVVEDEPAASVTYEQVWQAWND